MTSSFKKAFSISLSFSYFDILRILFCVIYNLYGTLYLIQVNLLLVLEAAEKNQIKKMKIFGG